MPSVLTAEPSFSRGGQATLRLPCPFYVVLSEGVALSSHMQARNLALSTASLTMEHVPCCSVGDTGCRESTRAHTYLSYLVVAVRDYNDRLPIAMLCAA